MPGITQLAGDPTTLPPVGAPPTSVLDQLGATAAAAASQAGAVALDAANKAGSVASDAADQLGAAAKALKDVVAKAADSAGQLGGTPGNPFAETCSGAVSSIWSDLWAGAVIQAGSSTAGALSTCTHTALAAVKSLVDWIF